MKPLTLCLFSILFLSIIQAQKNPPLPNPRIQVKYDRFSDLSTVDLSMGIIGGGIVDLGGGSVYVPPVGSTSRALEMAVIGVCEGQDLNCPSPRVALVLTSRSEDWLYLRTPNLLQVIIDGETRSTLGEMKRIDSDVLKRSSGVVEQLRLDVPFSVIQRLSKANKIEMRAGPDEFELTKSQIEDIRDWMQHFPAALHGPK
jgi:hypothetical protein